jgi:hypoxanthine phosphoribosyltransferase
MSVDFNTIMNWVFGIFGFAGTIFSIISERARKKAEKLSKSLSWSELQAGTNDLCKKVRRDFQPDVILTPNLRGGIIAELINDQFDRHIPVFVGQIFWKGLGGEIKPIPNHIEIKTGKWMLYIPEGVVEYKDLRLLIVDDFSMSGDTVSKVKNQLVARGFNPDLIKTASLFTTKVAIQNNKTTDYYWKVSEDDSFYFPWGKAK